MSAPTTERDSAAIAAIARAVVSRENRRMGDGRGCCRVAVPVTCWCPRGVWPACGVAVRCGTWEAHARGVGYVIIEDPELPEGHALIVEDCAPVLFLRAGQTARAREEAICYLLSTQWIAVNGWPAAAHDISHVLARLGARAAAVA